MDVIKRVLYKIYSECKTHAEIELITLEMINDINEVSNDFADFLRNEKNVCIDDICKDFSIALNSLDMRLEEAFEPKIWLKFDKKLIYTFKELMVYIFENYNKLKSFEENAENIIVSSIRGLGKKSADEVIEYIINKNILNDYMKFKYMERKNSNRINASIILNK